MKPMVYRPRPGTCIRLLRDFRALFHKTWLLTVRKPGQTVVEILLAYTFIGLLLGMRYILDRRYVPPLQIPTFRPQDYLTFDVSSNVIYFYPSSLAPYSLVPVCFPALLDNTCAATIVRNAVSALHKQWPRFPTNSELINRQVYHRKE